MALQARKSADSHQGPGRAAHSRRNQGALMIRDPAIPALQLALGQRAAGPPFCTPRALASVCLRCVMANCGESRTTHATRRRADRGKILSCRCRAIQMPHWFKCDAHVKVFSTTKTETRH